MNAGQILVDLDRCDHGRHHGDPCFGCPEGMSAGNPHMSPGQIIGYGLDGVLIVVPGRADKHRPEAWYRR